LWRKSFAQNIVGDLDGGLASMEARLRRAQFGSPSQTRIARWDGRESLRGKRVLAWAEAGLGDTLQFCRYAPMLAREGAAVVLQVQEPLRGLLAQSFPDCEVVTRADEASRCDLQVPLMSLPYSFRTRLDSIPAPGTYLRPPPPSVERWRAHLGTHDGRPRIGIACSGSANTRLDNRRSIALEKFAPLAAGGSLYLVQKEIRDPDHAWLAANQGSVRDLSADLADFSDTAAAVACMDLVVTVDTSLAHLSGALGKATWILLGWESEWRWLLDRDDSPWYSTARLFRQRRGEPWDAVIGRVLEALRERSR